MNSKDGSHRRIVEKFIVKIWIEWMNSKDRSHR